jgi:hypothetical protein
VGLILGAAALLFGCEISSGLNPETQQDYPVFMMRYTH